MRVSRRFGVLCLLCLCGCPKPEQIEQGRIAEGTVTGVVQLQDGASPSSVKLEFFLNGNVETSLSPNGDGSFSQTLREGNFSLLLSANGYDSSGVDNIHVAAGTWSLQPVTLKISAGAIRVRVRDKQGIPYRGLPLTVHNRTLSEEWGTSTTDRDGYLNLNSIPFGLFDVWYYAPPAMTDPSLLFVSRPELPIRDRGHTFYRTVGTKFDVTLPKVVHLDCPDAPTRTPQSVYEYFGPKVQYIAQSLTLSSSASICGIGMGLGSNWGNEPDSLALYSDDNGIPDDKILRAIPRYGVMLSSASYGVIANLCSNGKHPLALDRNRRYWMVAHYAALPSQIFVGHCTSLPASGIPALESTDGSHWTNANLKSGVGKSLLTFLVE